MPTTTSRAPRRTCCRSRTRGSRPICGPWTSGSATRTERSGQRPGRRPSGLAWGIEPVDGEELRAGKGGEALATTELERGGGRAPAGSTGWVRVAGLEDLPPGSALEVRHGRRVYALFRLGDSITCLDGLCPHHGGAPGGGGPGLGRGDLPSARLPQVAIRHDYRRLSSAGSGPLLDVRGTDQGGIAVARPRGPLGRRVAPMR
ncbi:MAG: Rieske 2Fe-2S domain-containing protein [Planctomycetaceae bacterium]